MIEIHKIMYVKHLPFYSCKSMKKQKYIRHLPTIFRSYMFYDLTILHVLRFYGLTFLTCLFLSSCRSDESLSVCFTGDLLLDRGVQEQINIKGVNSLFKYVQPVFTQYDAVAVNLECPITNVSSPVHKKYVFRGDPAWLPALVEAGITHAAMANNHSYDQGRDAMTETRQLLTDAGIQVIGFGTDQTEACSPTIIRKGHTQVAIFNSVLLPLENWVYLDDKPGMCQATIDDLVKNIQAYKLTHPQCYAVALLHWGVEYALHPTEEQRRQARRLLDAGADAVVGHHPHVVQDVEQYHGKLIIYSLGNFVFDAHRPDAQQGLMAGLTFKNNGVFVNFHPIDIRQCTPIPK